MRLCVLVALLTGLRAERFFGLRIKMCVCATAAGCVQRGVKDALRPRDEPSNHIRVCHLKLVIATLTTSLKRDTSRDPPMLRHHAYMSQSISISRPRKINQDPSNAFSLTIHDSDTSLLDYSLPSLHPYNTCVRRSTCTGLLKYPSHPASIHLSISPLIAFAVIAQI
jgi:hypothetical protein